MLTQFITTVPVSAIGPSVADFSARAEEITAATDFLFQGFCPLLARSLLSR